MTESLEHTICVGVDLTNPGQFFACCGLLEVADRLCGGAEGWFEGDRFKIRADQAFELSDLLRRFKASQLIEEMDGDVAPDAQEDEDEKEGGKAQPLALALAGAAHPMRLDWWTDKSLKPWAGSMDARVIFSAMKNAIDASSTDPFNDFCVVHDLVVGAGANGGRSQSKQGKKREPFYFDARRGASARSLDIGFAPDALKMTSAAFPAVEALCLVGLQRFRPMPTKAPRVFDYHAWSLPLDVNVASAAVCGLLPQAAMGRFRFENAFRTDQRKHKAYSPAVPMHGDHDDRNLEEV